MPLPNISKNDFYMLNMNIGTDAGDYGHLHPKHLALKDEPLTFLLKKCEDRDIEIRSTAKEKIFSFVGKNAREIEGLTQEQKKTLAHLIFEEGLDVLEYHLDTLSSLIQDHQQILFPIIERKVNDAYGSKIFKEQFPKLHNYLKTHHNKSLPDLLKAAGLEVITSRLKKFFSPFFRAQQDIKDRLSANFFEKVTVQPQKPAVITLQEVYDSKIPEQLKKQGYITVRTSEQSDTLIALEASRFKDVQYIEISEHAVGAYAKDKKTKEEFIFISAHIPGYNLEIPKNENDLEEYLITTERTLESHAFQVINKLNEHIKDLKGKHPKAKFVIQGDFNSFPEYFAQAQISQAIKNLDVFKKMEESGFSLLRTNQPTELLSPAEHLKERELDYVFTSTSLQGRVKIVSPEDQELSLAKIEGDQVHFDPTLLFSDHRPIWTSVSQKPKQP